jgi:3-mercaptopyruvate sulfurtransferase SseA
VLESAKNWIVSTDWLASHLDAPDLVIFDASWHLPTAGRDPKAEYLEGHIPGANGHRRRHAYRRLRHPRHVLRPTRLVDFPRHGP